MESRRALVLVSLAALAAPAAASPLGDALARHGDADVAALRPRAQGSGLAADEVAARCTLGAVYAKRGDLPRAALYLTGCENAALPDDVAAPIVRAVRDVKRRLEASQLAALDIVTQPEGLIAEIDALPGESFATPATVWVAAGSHVVRARRGERWWSRQVTAEPHRNGVVIVETDREAHPAPPRTVAIDFAQDDPGHAIEQHSGPPPDIKHPSLIRDKYRGVPEGDAGPQLDDPLASRALPSTRRDTWLGFRLAGGMFDDGATAARAGLAVGLAARRRLGDTMFAAVRVDWSRRGGDAMTGAIDVLGAGAGLGATIAGHGAGRGAGGLAVALIGQLRGDLRLADQRDGAPVRRAGLGITAGIELALPSTPLSLGARIEQGLTELVPGARDSAALIELGVDLR